MIDKQLEEKIKKTETFIEFWSKFNEIYREAISKSGEPDNYEKEQFASTSRLVAARFEELTDCLGMSPRQKVAKYYPVYEILSQEKLEAVSDERLDRLKECWTESFILLYSLLDRF